MPGYVRTLEELRAHAVLSWPQVLRDRAAESSVLPLLLETQDKFISALSLADSGPTAWKEVVDFSKDLPGNLFLKHLIVLSDVGGEPLTKLEAFPSTFRWAKCITPGG